MLGQVSCGKNKVCSQVRKTANGGKTWSAIGTIPAPIPKVGNPGAGITEIRFATTEIGWAFGPDLYRTADGGKSWKTMPLPGNGKQVLDLTTTATDGLRCRLALRLRDRDLRQQAAHGLAGR